MNLMEFLTENNQLCNKIINIIFAFVEAFIYLKIFTAILKIKYTKKQAFTYVISSGLIGILSLFLPNPYSFILNILFLIFSLYFIFKQNTKNVCVASIFVYALAVITGFLTQVLFNIILKISYSDIFNFPLYRFISLVLNYSILYSISLFIKQRTNIFKHIRLPLKLTTIINLIFGIIAIFIQSYIFSIYKDQFPNQLKIIALISQVLYFSISMYSLYRTNKLEQTSKDLETEKLYNKTLTLLHDNIRCFKHDFNNIVQAIGGYLALNDMKGLKEYYSQLLDDCKQTNNLNLLNPETINNPSIYSLLTNKYYLAQQNGINMTFNIFTDLSTINFNIYEFTRILGILLDNAIEAAKETEDKLLEIEFRTDKKKQIFIIENSFINNDNISITKIFEKGYSTKENNSGLGLWKVHNILSQNTNIDLYTTIKANKFSQELDVYFN